MTIKDWFEKAKREDWAIGAFNVANLETFKAIVEAAAEKKSPIIIESSPGETDWMGAENVVDIARNYQDEYQIPIFVNLDHAETLAQCMEGIEIGYDLIHFDGSALSFDENVNITKQVVAEARKKGLLVEAEIDRMARKSSEVYKEQISADELKKTFSDPQKVKEFVGITQIDIMAALFGNIHGIFPTQPPLDFELLLQIKQAIPDTFLSLHGGSGIPNNEVRKAIEIGKIVKVNINTEMRKAFRETLEDELEENPDEYATYKLMPDVVASVKKVVSDKIGILGSGDKL